MVRHGIAGRGVCLVGEFLVGLRYGPGRGPEQQMVWGVCCRSSSTGWVCVCGLLGVGEGIRRRSWLAIITGAIGLAMLAYEAWILVMNR